MFLIWFFTSSYSKRDIVVSPFDRVIALAGVTFQLWLLPLQHYTSTVPSCSRVLGPHVAGLMMLCAAAFPLVLPVCRILESCYQSGGYLRDQWQRAGLISAFLVCRLLAIECWTTRCKCHGCNLWCYGCSRRIVFYWPSITWRPCIFVAMDSFLDKLLFYT